MVFVFEFVYRPDYVNRFLNIKTSLYPWDEAYLIMMDDCFVRILLSIFASMFIREIGLKFSFFVRSLFGLVIRVLLAS